jgi:hypothetical protein
VCFPPLKINSVPSGKNHHSAGIDVGQPANISLGRGQIGSGTDDPD